MKIKIIHIILFLFLPCIVSGQELRFQNLTIEDGFINNTGNQWHNAIHKDEEGFVWFVASGLSRFDGEHFKNYTRNPSNPKSIAQNSCTVIGEDADGRLWIGTTIWGINIFDKEKESFSKFSPITSKDDNTLSSIILFIEKDREGNMWYGSYNGVSRWNKESNIAENFGHYFQGSNAFLQQKSGTIWIGDRNGLHRMVEGEDRFEKIPSQKPLGFITDLIELENGKIWMAAEPNFWEFDPENQTFTDLLQQPWLPDGFRPNCFSRGNNGDIWMANVPGILRHNQHSKKTSFHQNDRDDPLTLPPSTPESILVDAFDNLFVLMGTHGVALAHAQPHPFEKVGDIEAMDFIAIDSHRVLIRDFHKGGIIYDTKQKVITEEKLPVGPGYIFLPSMALRGDSLLWIWDHNKITSYHLRTGKLTTAPPNPVHTLYVNLDKNGRLWNSLSYLDESQNKWVDVYPELRAAFPDLPEKRPAYANIRFDEKNRLWTRNDLQTKMIRYDLESKKGKRYDFEGAPFDGTNGRLYLSDEGLRVHDIEKDSFQYLTHWEGLMHSYVFHVCEDGKENAWIGGPKGLQKYDWNKKEYTNIDFEDGFPMKGNAVVRRIKRGWDGYLYFDINLKKIFRFHPDSLHTNAESAPVQFLDFFLNLHPVLPGDSNTVLQKNLRYTASIQLSYDQADFGFSFSMPTYFKSAQTEYFYKLEPYQNEWLSNGTSNVVHLTNISPGAYTFRVKAKSASGIWSAGEAAVQVAISPPWWETWWAYSMYALLFFAAVYGIYRFSLNRQYEKQEAFRLKELDSLKSRLYTNITHEFRTPLTVIMGMADNLTNHQNERKLISRNSKNLLRLINQLLDLSKLDSGSMKMDMVQGDVINYLRYLTESFFSMAQEKKIQLTFSTQVEELEIDFDEVKMQHVIFNLLSNALKFTKPEGKVTIYTDKKKRNNKPWLHIIVKDTGIGIPEHQLPHIFDRFYQADSSTTRKGEGTGIGLALTKELIQMMGGEIVVESKVGEGTEFKILLPANKAATTAKLDAEYTTSQTIAVELVPGLPPPPSKEGGDRFVTPQPLEEVEGRPHLLLIEDNKDVATYIETLLSNEYEVALASNGQEGIDRALETIPDIIISDVMMPEKDGYEVCEILKQDERTSHIPIILLTAKAEQKDKVVGLRHGADAYLMKPFDKAELFVRLEKLLELRRTLQERYASSSEGPSSSHTPAEPTIEDIFLEKLRRATQEVMSDPDNAIAELEKAMHLSQMQLYRKLKALTGKTPSIYIRSIRLQKAMQLLKTTDLTVSEIAYDVGFTSPNYFSRAFSDEFGFPPTTVRN